jgi:ornithine cyclodeaminase
MQIIDAAAVHAALPFERLIPALTRMFQCRLCEVPRRQVLEIAQGPGQTLTSLIMPAWIPGQFYGVKIINMAQGNAAKGLPGLHAAYLLHDAVTGVALASIDGDALTHRRTAAASALAARFVARDDASELLLVGAGRIARLLPQAMRTVRPIRRVTIWARSAEKSARLADQLCAEGFEARATNDLAKACQSADIISCATLAREPLIRGQWLPAGTHLDLIGSFTAEMREADDAALAAADLYVDSEEALVKSGDLIAPISRGVLSASDLRATLTDLCREEVPGRTDRQARTVFKSVGLALEDLAAAMLVWESRQLHCPG